MGNEIAQYDASKLMDAVRDRIKAEFIGLIPEDTWKQMVKNEVDRFFAKQEVTSWGERPRTATSNFQEEVHTLLKAEVTVRLKEYFGSPEWQHAWNEHGIPLASENTKKLIAEKMPEIVQGAVGSLVQNVINSMRHA